MRIELEKRPKVSLLYAFLSPVIALVLTVVAGLVLGLTYLGGEAAQISLGLSDKVVRVFQGLLLFFVLSCDTLIQYRIRIVWRRMSGGVVTGQAVPGAAAAEGAL